MLDLQLFVLNAHLLPAYIEEICDDGQVVFLIDVLKLSLQRFPNGPSGTSNHLSFRQWLHRKHVAAQICSELLLLLPGELGN